MAKHSAIRARYTYLTVGGTEYRVYYEETGSGIPVLLQHTAGADGRQWRHLLEDRELTRSLRFIAYDLPFHGKSLPPSEAQWWTQEYQLSLGFLLQFVETFADEMSAGNESIFMGCSMGGHLAADLALHAPGRFRATIAIEGALATHDQPNEYFWHPRVSDETKAATMYTLMSPTSPEKYRRETSWIYAQGAPGVHRGDLFYYLSEHDLRGRAKDINTEQTALYVLSGEYDWSASPERCKALADAVPGAKYVFMEGLGHFPMSEDPRRFKKYFADVVDEILASDK